MNKASFHISRITITSNTCVVIVWPIHVRLCLHTIILLVSLYNCLCGYANRTLSKLKVVKYLWLTASLSGV